MRMEYRSYKEDHEEVGIVENLVISPGVVKRVSCPICGSKDYVLPLRAGGLGLIGMAYLENPDAPIRSQIDSARFSWTNIEEGYKWDCQRCQIYFRFQPWPKNKPRPYIIYD